ncbi:MAG: DNA polymerase III subunit delta [Candidatus Phytoplasma sp.]|nr:DNA polymerase III subunit delta [Phytoplasma sp.]
MKELVYVILSQQFFLVEKRIEEILEAHKEKDIDIIKYDMSESELVELEQELQTISLFSNEKMIIIKSVEKLYQEKKENIAFLINYLKKPSEDIQLIFMIEELVENHELTLAIKKHAYIEEIDSLGKDAFPNYVKNAFSKENMHIDEDAILELIERTDYDLYILSAEIEKLKLYSYESKKINKSLVTKLVSRNVEDNIYELTKYLLENNQNKTYEVFQDLMTRSEEPLKIINQISQRTRELIYTKDLLKKQYTQEQIAAFFNYKKGRAYFLIKDAKAISYDKLEKLLFSLSQLDYKIKSGQIDKKIGLELLLLGSA